MNPDSPKTPREEMETWLTSLLLGELSAGEAAAVRELIKHDPELAKLHDDLKSTIHLVRETSVKAAEPVAIAVSEPKLSVERREKLLAQFKTIKLAKPIPRKRRRLTLGELAAAIAIIGILAALAMPSLKSFNSDRRYAVKSAAAPEEARLAAETASTPTAPPPVVSYGSTPKLEDSYLNVLKSGQVDKSLVHYGISTKSGIDAASPEPAKKPVGLTPVPARGTTPIVLPALPETDSPRQPEGNYAVTASVGGRAEPANEPTWIGDTEKTDQPQSADNKFVYRYASATPTPALGGIQTPAQQPQATVVTPSTGLPAAEPPPLADPSTGLPVTAVVPGDAPPKLELRKFAVNSETLKRAIGTVSASDEAFRKQYSPNSSLQTIPRVSVVGQVQAGGGGGGGGGGGARPVNPKLGDDISETPPRSADISLSDSAGVTLKAEEGKTAVAYYGGYTGGQVPRVKLDGADRFTTDNRARTLAEATAEVRLQGVTTLNGGKKQILSLGDSPTVGRLYTNSSLRGYYDDGAVTDGGRLTPQSNVYSMDVVGYATVPTQAGVSGALRVNETTPRSNTPQMLMEQEDYKRYLATRFEREKIYAEQQKQLEQLKGLDKTQLREKLPELTSDAELTETALGVKLAEQKLATLQKESSTPALELQRARGQVDELKKKADNQAAGVMAKLETEHAMAKSELEGLVASVETARKLDQERLARSRPYYDKKRELEDMVDFQRLLTRKMNLEEIDLHLPRSAGVEILERAEAKNQPNQSFWGGIRNAVSGNVERATRIKLERDIEELSTTGTAPRSSNPYDPHFLETEFEIIKSETVLGRVAEVLGLSKNTDSSSKKSEAIAQLRKRLDLQAVPNSTVLEIRAKAGNPKEAAEIANTVAEVYKLWRLDKGQELVKGGLKSLEERSRQQEEMIRKAKVELAQLGQSLGISESDASGLTPQATTAVAADLPIRKPSTNAPIPQPEIQTSENNFSTFSLNVSDVSFKLAQASLEKGQMPDVASVRSEEFINAFDYRDPEPAAGAPIAFAYERARYPFAHNRDLLRFSLKTAAAGRQAGRPLNIVLLLDNSGSMERADRVQIIREALRVLAGQLQPQDKLSVITFARTARLVADGISGDKAGEVTEAVSGLTPEGGTNLEEAMNLGYQTAARHYLVGGINRVILLTDGAANLGDVEPASLKEKVEAARKQGIALDCFGIGWEGFNDDLLEVLSRNGDGRYGFINSPEEAATEFAGQLAGALKVAASDVKVQVEFNPRRVTSYRQIGYAKHQLTKEQFRDNTVDAAEISAQEAGNALYTVEVNPAGDGPLCTVRVRYKIPGTSDYREQAWDVPFTGNALSLEQASPAMRLAASASAFSEWLVASPFAGEVSPDGVLNVLRGVPEVFGADSRPKTLEWMIRQAKSIEGK